MERGGFPFPGLVSYLHLVRTKQKIFSRFLLPEMQKLMVMMMMRRRGWICEIEELRRGDFY